MKQNTYIVSAEVADIEKEFAETTKQFVSQCTQRDLTILDVAALNASVPGMVRVEIQNAQKKLVVGFMERRQDNVTVLIMPKYEYQTNALLNQQVTVLQWLAKDKINAELVLSILFQQKGTTDQITAR